MEKRVFTARDGLGDVMMGTISRQVFAIEDPDKLAVIIKENVDTQLEWALTVATRNNCVKASATAAYELYKICNYLFRHIGLIIGSNSSERPFKKNTWPTHVAFIAQGTDDRWYLGSPANYNPDSRLSSNLLIEAARLDDALRTFQKAEGGIWPDHSFIKRGIDRRLVAAMPVVLEQDPVPYVSIGGFWRTQEGNKTTSLETRILTMPENKKDETV